MDAPILICSTYPTLLETYRLILERSGFGVIAAGCVQEARMMLANEPIEICVFCSSLSAEECDELASTLSIFQPDARYIMLKPGANHYRGLSPTGNQINGPEALVAGVKAMMAVHAA